MGLVYSLPLPLQEGHLSINRNYLLLERARVHHQVYSCSFFLWMQALRSVVYKTSTWEWQEFVIVTLLNPGFLSYILKSHLKKTYLPAVLTRYTFNFVESKELEK